LKGPQIEDGIDVISVGLSHKRFLDIATRLKRPVWVVTDNDRKTVDEVRKRFADYISDPNVSVHTGGDPNLNTLEPQLVHVNELDKLNAVLGTDYQDKDEACAGMQADKTASALAIFESTEKLVMPKYIQDVIDSQKQ
jgi:putative ATP-dependent endonuclease of OLD family